MKIYPTLLIVFFLVTACAREKDYLAMAEELCACMQPMIQLNQEVEEAIEKMDTAAIQSLMRTVESVARESETCTEKVENKYGTLKAEEEQRGAEALQKVCPEVAAILDAPLGLN